MSLVLTRDLTRRVHRREAALGPPECQRCELYYPIGAVGGPPGMAFCGGPVKGKRDVLKDGDGMLLSYKIWYASMNKCPRGSELSVVVGVESE